MLYLIALEGKGVIAGLHRLLPESAPLGEKTHFTAERGPSWFLLSRLQQSRQGMPWAFNTAHLVYSSLVHQDAWLRERV